MRVKLAYYKKGLELEIPETPGFVGVLQAKDPPALKGSGKAIIKCLGRPINSPPLKEIAYGKKDACIVISDITRPVPNKLILPPILETLEEQGVVREKITILIGTGIHRPNEEEELIQLVGKDIASSYRIVNHLSRRDEDMTYMGKTSTGIPIFINRYYVESELKILTGFIEPHMWAGFSGGRKSILPGICSLETMKYMHGYEMVAHPNTRYGLLEGNPFHEAGLEVLRMVGADFIVNVTLDQKKRITGVWCGDPQEAHLQGCNFLKKYCLIKLDEPLEFVITTNSGYPLDCDLYQSVKGITGAANVVRDGGAILIATACFEGVGSEDYQRLLDRVESVDGFLKMLTQPGFFIPDQWCAQEMYQVLRRCRVVLYAEGIPSEHLLRYLLEPVNDIESTIQCLLDEYGYNARWAVIPSGPLTITQLK
ncbi:nickel-dependent lactate racemase [Candidatus Sumerlaeota bacterium]|nr:nickel-dependent lactate racemase [Candidatus Sumerlaeota bacterium]